jgi:molybdopterin molybdotransferase
VTGQPLLSVSDALARVLAGAGPVGSEAVDYAAALGRTLVEPLAARRTQPPFRSSAMDGYAVRAANAQTGAELRVIGESSAGHVFEQPLNSGEAVRIFTGGALPEGADAILIQENAERDADRVRVLTGVTEGQFVRAEGLDFRSGDVLVEPGQRLSPRMVGLAAATGNVQVHVARKPCVAVLSTGDELVPTGAEPRRGQITASNNSALCALVEAAGGEATDFGIAADDLDTIRAACRRARDEGFDVLVTTGGASVGDHDLIRPALAAEGMTLDFWRIAMRPGRPMMFGTLGGMRTLGLPGNPVSAHVCALLFLVPLVRALLGRREIHHRLERAQLGIALPANDWREDYVRGRLTFDSHGVPVASPAQKQDSSMLRVLADSNCLIVRAANEGPQPAGSVCRVLRLTDFD